MQIFTRQVHDAHHPITGSDARIKLLSALVLLVMVISCTGPLFPLFIAGCCLAGSLAIGVRLQVLAVRFAEPLLLAVLVIILKLLFSGKVVIFSFSILGLELVGHQDGLREGLMIASRIGGAVSLVALLGFSTPFTDLMAALAWFRVPKGFIEVALFAWRYLFLLFDDAQVIYSAQKNRLGYSGYRRGLRSFGTLAGALVIKAFDNSQTVTSAMIQRGYDGTMPLLKHKPFRVCEVAWSLAFIVCMGIIRRI